MSDIFTEILDNTDIYNKLMVSESFTTHDLDCTDMPSYREFIRGKLLQKLSSELHVKSVSSIDSENEIESILLSTYSFTRKELFDLLKRVYNVARENNDDWK